MFKILCYTSGVDIMVKQLCKIFPQVRKTLTAPAAAPLAPIETVTHVNKLRPNSKIELLQVEIWKS